MSYTTKEDISRVYFRNLRRLCELLKERELNFISPPFNFITTLKMIMNNVIDLNTFK